MKITKQTKQVITGLTIQLDQKEVEMHTNLLNEAKKYEKLSDIPHAILDDIVGTYFSCIEKMAAKMSVCHTCIPRQQKLIVECRSLADVDKLDQILKQFNMCTPVPNYAHALLHFTICITDYDKSEALRLEFSKQGISFVSIPVDENGK